MREYSQSGRQSLLAALLLSLLDLDVNVVGVFELFLPLAALAAEAIPILLFALVNSIRQFKVGLGADLFDHDLESPQEISP